MVNDRSWKSHAEPSRERARELRKATTVPERRLWYALRAGRLDGVKFRRQHPVGPYIVDFYCHEHSLVIELDGRSHADRYEADLKRQLELEARGLLVIRFGNDDVLCDLEGVIEAIARIVGLSPRAPSPY